MKLRVALLCVAMFPLPVAFAVNGTPTTLVSSYFHLDSMSGRMESGSCAPGKTYIVTAVWRNTSKLFIQNLSSVTTELRYLSGGNPPTLQGYQFQLPFDNIVDPTETFFGTYRLTLPTCAAFRFFVDLYGTTSDYRVQWVGASDALWVGQVPADNLAAFNQTPGTPGGPGGFGGPPVGSGFTELQHPFHIENFQLSNSSPSVTGTITLNLISNVATFQKSYTLTETGANTDVYVDANDELAIYIDKYGSNTPGVQNTINTLVASMAFGARQYVNLTETAPGANVFRSDLIELVGVFSTFPGAAVVDSFTATIKKNGAVISTGLVTETGANTNIYDNAGATVEITLNRMTANGAAGADDFTSLVFVNGSVFALVDAMETGANTLEFRTDALHNNGVVGTGPGALKALLVHDRWEAEVIDFGVPAIQHGLPGKITLAPAGGGPVQSIDVNFFETDAPGVFRCFVPHGRRCRLFFDEPRPTDNLATRLADFAKQPPVFREKTNQPTEDVPVDTRMPANPGDVFTALTDATHLDRVVIKAPVVERPSGVANAPANVAGVFPPNQNLPQGQNDEKEFVLQYFNARPPAQAPVTSIVISPPATSTGGALTWVVGAPRNDTVAVAAGPGGSLVITPLPAGSSLLRGHGTLIRVRVQQSGGTNSGDGSVHFTLTEQP